MNLEQFKESIRQTKDSLRGKTLIVNGNNCERREFTTLKAFGNYILEVAGQYDNCYINNNIFTINNPVMTLRNFGTSA